MVTEPTPAGSPPENRRRRRATPGNRVLESVATGVAAGGLLVILGACLVASFRPDNLYFPYWTGIPRLRTDTSGAVGFLLTGLSIVVSEFFRLRRRAPDDPAESHRRKSLPNSWAIAILRAIAIMSTIVVIYLSVNAVTHPYTLYIHATHFATWPTEGTLRVVALLLASVAIGVLRFLAAGRSGAGWNPVRGLNSRASTRCRCPPGPQRMRGSAWVRSFSSRAITCSIRPAWIISSRPLRASSRATRGSGSLAAHRR